MKRTVARLWRRISRPIVAYLSLRWWAFRHYYRSTWEPEPTIGGSFLRCVNCEQGYNQHGAPIDVARLFGVPEARRHLICQKPWKLGGR